eukprot:TRINITY_DN6566_c0_g6_i1.p1 TRINITY_DN6566_c0_g6~~TRINITY_DN6566_c0_g6_i1.p1  ORF type:complete len:305 (-),score=57.27 TRINITY_DN6566_c0_g6_i1:206-1015(-)
MAVEPTPSAELGALPSQPPQLTFIPQISTPRTHWRRAAKGKEAVYTAPAFNTDSLNGATAHPGTVDWLLQTTSFIFSAPEPAQEAAADAAFRRCKYDARCASETLREAVSTKGLPATLAAERHEELLSWWCRRCFEERHALEAGEAVRRAGDRSLLARGFLLATWCRFPTTARRASQQASAITGGHAGLIRTWQRCRDARAWPAAAAEEAAVSLNAGGAVGGGSTADVENAVQVCCGDFRCLARALDSAGADEALASSVWSRAERATLA